MKRTWVTGVLLVIAVVVLWAQSAVAQQASLSRILIHMKTSLAEDDAQICAVPNVAWAAFKAGHKVTILEGAVRPSPPASRTCSFLLPRHRMSFYAGSSLHYHQGRAGA